MVREGLSDDRLNLSRDIKKEALPGGRASQAEEVAKAASLCGPDSMRSRTRGRPAVGWGGLVAGAAVGGAAGLQIMLGLPATTRTLDFAMSRGEVIGEFCVRKTSADWHWERTRTAVLRADGAGDMAKKTSKQLRPAEVEMVRW